MKSLKLSLVSIIALGTYSFGADTVADAFKEGKVTGAIQAYYWQRDNGVKDADILNFGLDLSYETARYKGFGFKGTFQSSSSPFINDDGRELFKGDMYGSGASLSEAYISYGYGKTNAQIGRMYFATPLIYSSGTRMNKEAFEGALVTNTDIPDTKLTLGYVQKMQNRTDGEGNFGKFSENDFGGFQGDVKDGAYTFVVENASIPDVNLTLAYLDAKDLMDVGYAEAAYSNDMFGLAAQYYYSDHVGNGDNSTDLLGLKANVQFDKLGFVAAYATTGDQYVYAGLGNGADYSFTGSPILSDSYKANTDSYKVGVSYAFMSNFSVGANYVLEDEEHKDISYTSVTADYAFSGALEGLSVALLYDKEGEDGEDEELRLNIVYSF